MNTNSKCSKGEVVEPKEKKEFVELIGGVIDQKVRPGLEKLEKLIPKVEKLEGIIPKIDKIATSVEYIREQVAENSENIEVMKEEMQDTGYTIERIETKLDATIRRQDDASVKTSQLARRVLRLESKKSW